MEGGHTSSCWEAPQTVQSPSHSPPAVRSCSHHPSNPVQMAYAVETTGHAFNDQISLRSDDTSRLVDSFRTAMQSQLKSSYANSLLQARPQHVMMTVSGPWLLCCLCLRRVCSQCIPALGKISRPKQMFEWETGREILIAVEDREWGDEVVG